MNFNKILNELCWRLDTGIPDLTNSAHQEKLKEVLQMHGHSDLVIAEVISNLNEADKVDPDTMVKYKDDNGESKEMVFSSANNQPAGTPAKIAADKLQPEDEEPESGEDEPTTDADATEDGESEGAETSEESPEDLAKKAQHMFKNPEAGSDAAEEQAPKEETSSNGIKGKSGSGDYDVKSDMLEYGYGGYEKATGNKPAPGGPGSAFNEIASGEGVHMLVENSDLSEQDLAMQMYNQYKDTKLAKEQKKTAGIKVSEIPDVENKDFYTKCLVSARSAKTKFEQTNSRVKSLQESGKFGKPKNIETFYGATASIEAQVEMIKSAKSVILPDGTSVNISDAESFVRAGGGGMNPSDTSTFVQDETGNLLLQFHSDKTTTNDIQDNSTLAQEGANYQASISNSSLSSSEKEIAAKVVDDYTNRIKTIEENYTNQTIPIAKSLKKIDPRNQLEIIENDRGTLMKNLDHAVLGKKGVKNIYKPYMPLGADPENLSTSQKYEMVMNLVIDGKGKPHDVKVINKVALQLQKQDSSIEGIDVKKNLSVQRKKVVNLQRERINELNKQTASVAGEEIPLGTLMEAEESIKGFHLGLMDYPPKAYEEGDPKSMIGSSLDINMGGHLVNGDVLRRCLGVNSTDEFKKQFRLQEKEQLIMSGDDVTGKTVFVYAIDSDGNEKPIGRKVYRSKDGATGKTSNTMAYSTEMQNCFKGK